MLNREKRCKYCTCRISLHASQYYFHELKPKLVTNKSLLSIIQEWNFDCPKTILLTSLKATI